MFFCIPMCPSEGENGSGTFAPQKPISLTCKTRSQRKPEESVNGHVPMR